jgi:hypothetical protein
MIALMMGHNPMEIMWNHEKVTVSVQKTLCQIFVITIKWMLLTSVFIGLDKTKWGKVKCSTHVQHDKNSDKMAWAYWPRKECHYAL